VSVVSVVCCAVRGVCDGLITGLVEYCGCVSVLCCAVRGLCDGLITHFEKSYRLWCVTVLCLCVNLKRREWGDPDPRGAAAPQEVNQRNSRHS
jgi:hypothetical protein